LRENPLIKKSFDKDKQASGQLNELVKYVDKELKSCRQELEKQQATAAITHPKP